MQFFKGEPNRTHKCGLKTWEMSKNDFLFPCFVGLSYQYLYKEVLLVVVVVLHRIILISSGLGQVGSLLDNAEKKKLGSLFDAFAVTYAGLVYDDVTDTYSWAQNGRVLHLSDA